MAAMMIPVILLLLVSEVVGMTHVPQVPAIYVFGDSMLDVGNNNHFTDSLVDKANFPYHGIDYPGRKPTGRFSNGYNIADFLAMTMGFEESPPAFVSITDEAQESRGVNFASGGSGVFDATNPNVSISMNTQIKFFEKIKHHLTATKGKEAAELILSKSIFILYTVNNDMFSFYRTLGSQNITENKQFVVSVTTQFKAQLKKLYELGARKFALFGVARVGCSPVFRALNPNGSCAEDLNELSRLFNDAIKVELRSLSSRLAGMKHVFINTYNIVEAIVAHPSKYGFKELRRACCGSGAFNAAKMCLPNSTLCDDRREYLSWDFVHPTQATSKVYAEYAYHGSRRFVVPMNIKELIQD